MDFLEIGASSTGASTVGACGVGYMAFFEIGVC
jgi:hypothetical protein